MQKRVPKKYQIFLSSTFTDLIEERRALQEAILKMNHFPVGMELFSAASEDQWSVIEEVIQNADYYVLIIGFRYGSMTDEGISYTEKEYRYAKEQGIPILAFIKNEDVPSKPDQRENSQKQKRKLESFINEVKDGRMVEFWSSKEELLQIVTASLYKSFDKYDRPGWIRANDFRTEEIQIELVEQNQRIRALEQENAQLKDRLVIPRSPDFKLFINDQDSIELELPEWLSYNTIYAEYSPIDVDESRRGGVSPERLKKYENYNNSLPSKEILEKYIIEKRKFDLSTQHATPIALTLENFGNAKASNIIIELTFPDSVIVYDKDSLDTLEPPEAPSHAVHPDMERFQAMVDLSERFNATYNIFPVRTHLNKIPLSLLREPSNNIESLEDNTLNIRREQIIHTRCTVIKDYYLVPLKAGDFEIEVCIICEEIPEEKIFTFPIHIIDKINN